MAWSDIVSAIQQQAQASGLGAGETAVAEVIAWIETGGGASLYNANDNGGPSFGIFQFHTGGPGNPGELDAFAQWLHLPLFVQGPGPYGNINPAVAQQALNPATDAQFALRQGGYLYNSIVQGAGQGLSDLNLAVYVERYGQGADWSNPAAVIAAITNAWNKLFGTSTLPPVPPPPNLPGTAPGNTPPGQAPMPPGSPTNIGGPYIIQTPAGPIDLTPILQPLLGTFGTGLNDAIGLVNWLDQPAIYERIALVVIGGVLAIVGVIFFGLSFVPKGAVRAVPVVGGELSKVAGT